MLFLFIISSLFLPHLYKQTHFVYLHVYMSAGPRLNSKGCTSRVVRSLATVALRIQSHHTPLQTTTKRFWRCIFSLSVQSAAHQLETCAWSTFMVCLELRHFHSRFCAALKHDPLVLSFVRFIFIISFASRNLVINLYLIYNHFILMAQHPPGGWGPPHCWGFTITFRPNTTISRTPLD